MGNNLRWTMEEYLNYQRRQAAKLAGKIAPHVETPAELPTPKEVPPTPEDRLNKTERQFLKILERRGFKTIRIQEVTLKLAWDCRYTADFYTLSHNGEMTLWEVKGGFMREDGFIKLKVAASKFPEFKFVLAQKQGHKWTETIIRQ